MSSTFSMFGTNTRVNTHGNDQECLTYLGEVNIMLTELRRLNITGSYALPVKTLRDGTTIKVWSTGGFDYVDIHSSPKTKQLTIETEDTDKIFPAWYTNDGKWVIGSWESLEPKKIYENDEVTVCPYISNTGSYNNYANTTYESSNTVSPSIASCYDAASNWTTNTTYYNGTIVNLRHNKTNATVNDIEIYGFDNTWSNGTNRVRTETFDRCEKDGSVFVPTPRYLNIPEIHTNIVDYVQERYAYIGRISGAESGVYGTARSEAYVTTSNTTTTYRVSGSALGSKPWPDPSFWGYTHYLRDYDYNMLNQNILSINGTDRLVTEQYSIISTDSEWIEPSGYMDPITVSSNSVGGEIFGYSFLNIQSKTKKFEDGESVESDAEKDTVLAGVAIRDTITYNMLRTYYAYECNGKYVERFFDPGELLLGKSVDHSYPYMYLIRINK